MLDNGDRQPREVAEPPRARGKRSRDVKRSRTEVELLTEISAKLDRVIAVLAAQGKDRGAQIDIMSAAECDSNFIGTVVGMTPGAVRKHQSRSRGRGMIADDEAPQATSQ